MTTLTETYLEAWEQYAAQSEELADTMASLDALEGLLGRPAVFGEVAVARARLDAASARELTQAVTPDTEGQDAA